MAGVVTAMAVPAHTPVCRRPRHTSLHRATTSSRTCAAHPLDGASSTTSARQPPPASGAAGGHERAAAAGLMRVFAKVPREHSMQRIEDLLHGCVRACCFRLPSASLSVSQSLLMPA